MGRPPERLGEPEDLPWKIPPFSIAGNRERRGQKKGKENWVQPFKLIKA